MNDTISYQLPPWHLKGEGLIVFRFPAPSDIPSKYPQDILIRSPFWGKTIAGYYIGSYITTVGEHETTPWNEWGNVLGYAKAQRDSGLFISAMATDSSAAYTAGREVWGLNKIMGAIRFETEKNTGRAELQTDTDSVHLEWKTFGPAFPFSRPNWFLTSISGKMHKYQVRIPAQYKLCRIHLLKQEGPDFTGLKEGKWWGIRFFDADIIVNSPEAILP